MIGARTPISDIEFWSLFVALAALVVSLIAVAVGLIWSVLQKQSELRSIRSTQYHQLASWISDEKQPARQIVAVLDMRNYPEFKDASLFMLHQIRDHIRGAGAARLQAAIDQSIADLTGRKGRI